MRTPRDVLDRVALWRIDPTSLVRPDEQTTVRRIEVVRGAWGLVMLVGPTPLLRAISIDDDPAMIWTGRVLGARHLTQAVLSGARPSPEGLAMGVWVDAVHALCALGLAASSRRRAAAGIFDAVAAHRLGGRGLPRPGQPPRRPAHPHRAPRRDGPPVLRALPGGAPLADRVEQDRERLPTAERGGTDDAPGDGVCAAPRCDGAPTALPRVRPARRQPQRPVGHPAQQGGHLGRRQHRAVGGGVDQAEHRVRAGPGRRRAERGVGRAALRGPQVDVGALERAHPLARVVGQRGPVAVLHHDQRRVGQREVDVEVDQRPQAPRPGPSASATRRPPSPRSRSLIETSISASTESLDGKCL